MWWQELLICVSQSHSLAPGDLEPSPRPHLLKVYTPFDTTKRRTKPLDNSLDPDHNKDLAGNVTLQPRCKGSERISACGYDILGKRGSARGNHQPQGQKQKSAWNVIKTTGNLREKRDRPDSEGTCGKTEAAALGEM